MTDYSKTYRPDTPCPRGHRLRYKSNDVCVKCHRLHNKNLLEWYDGVLKQIEEVKREVESADMAQAALDRGWISIIMWREHLRKKLAELEQYRVAHL
jgi:hypothetical protein